MIPDDVCMTTYLSLAAFYASDRRREGSRERDFGLWWRGDGEDAPTYRAAYVRATGELYVMQHKGTPGGGRVDVAARFSTVDDAEDCLEGWEESCGAPGSIRWLYERVAPGARAFRERSRRPMTANGVDVA
jgi:hypothetical protein